MSRKNRILDTPLDAMPPDWQFYSAKIPTKLMLRVEKKRIQKGLVAKHLIIMMCTKFLAED